MKTDYRFFKLASSLLMCTLIMGCEAVAVRTQASADDPGSNNSAASENIAASIDAPLVSANDSLLSMLRYSRFVNGLSKQQVSDEFKRISEAYFIRPNDRSGLKRAILMMIPGTDFFDLPQAKQLFTEVLNSKDQSVPAFKEYAEFMLGILDSQEQSNSRYAKLLEDYRQETSKREQLEQKLEALKSIEENMIQRRNQ
jgi:hypothetical protein